MAGVNEYPEVTTRGEVIKKRSDFFYGAGARLLYQWRGWLGLELGYGIVVRDSNFPEFDYTVNRVRLTLRVAF